MPTIRRAGQRVAAIGMPVAEYPAWAGFSGDKVFVFSLPVGVAVDHGLYTLFGESGDDCGCIDIHDRHRFGLLLGFAARAQRFDLALALCERTGEERCTPRWVTHLRPEALVVGVVRAKGIAVRQQRLDAANVAHNGIWQQGEAGCGGEIIADQKVAVAGHEFEPDAAVGQVAQRSDDAGIEGIAEIIIARPVIEQVAEDGQAVRLACRAGEKVEKQDNCPRFIRGQVQVGNEQRCQTTSAFSITTSSTGTS